MKHVTDTAAREAALNPEQSFIVQAPAGSGKTELLTQRYLQLLAHAEQSPEEIIAITFTRKAAAEMRSRILKSLALASEPTPPKAEYQLQTWKLAKAALQKDESLGWSLQENPNRLRILTIDALATLISSHMPLLTGFGMQPRVAENPEPLYQEAARETLQALGRKGTQPELNHAIEQLLLHFDNNAKLLEHLLTRFLAQREQWLGHIIPHQHQPDTLKKQLEHNLEQITHEKIADVKKTFEPSLLSEALKLAERAGHAITDSPWNILSTLLLTQKGTWRKTVDKRQGFINADDRAAMRELLTTLSEDESLREALHALSQCPPTHYSDQQWMIVEALLSVLPRAAAELTLLFREHEHIDFIELNLRALAALGNSEEPTDLALYLDYRIRHLLVDEFQDTSVMQFHLIQKLVTGWQAGDGRTLFLVGDPMQSIYRFRNAEVGLFLRAKTQGIAGVSLKSLNLTCNFRSQPDLVKWTNRIFPSLFPQTADMAAGAVPYTPVNAIQSEEGFIDYTMIENGGPADEAEHVVKTIQTLQASNPQNSIAILVRSRSQLDDIIAALHHAKLAFHGVDIEALTEQAVIQDLLSLTRALTHLGDRLAWLSLLRAPFCGLSLNDLLILAKESQHKPLWTTLIQHPNLNALSTDAQVRLSRVTPILEQALQEQGRMPLAQWIKGCWLGLGGPAALTEADALSHAELFFKTIEAIAQPFSLSELERQLDHLYANSPSSDHSTLQIMTIHKAKGLEFDHVILPNLQRRNPYDASPILTWWERPTPAGTNDLLLAPIKATREKVDPLYAYLRMVENEKSHYEIARLFYVAVTRAKSSLHLIGSIKKEKEDFNNPVKGSFLHLMWSIESETLRRHLQQASGVNLEEPVISHLQRLSNDWKSFFSPKKTEKESSPNTPPPEENNLERHLGTFVHSVLEEMGNEGLTNWSAERIEKNTLRWRLALEQLGLNRQDALSALSSMKAPLIKLLKDTRAQWLLSNTHQEAYTEYALTAQSQDRARHYVIDRTFVDNNDVRWIIDYKTSQPKSESLNDFLDHQQKIHQPQLDQYASLFKLKGEKRPIRLALYFPLCHAWCEWDPESSGIVKKHWYTD